MPLTTDREKCAHQLRRFGFGASEAELTYYLQDGLDGAVDRLLAPERVADDPLLDIEELRGGKNNIVPMPAVVAWWASRLLTTRRPLVEKMTLFWHDHFATSASKVAAPMLMYAQNELLRAGALGSFRKLLTDVSKDPAMLFWLDNQQNVKGKPNENFAREVMELFTLGIGNYTEKDVQEAARAFTGWSIRRLGRQKRAQAEFFFRPRLHDDGVKTVLGTTAPLTGEDVLNLLCDLPRTSEYIATKIWEWFVYPKPTPATIAPYAKRFRDSGLDVSTLLRAIMRAPEFYSDRAERAVVKNPADLVVSTLRQLGVGEQMREAAGVMPAGTPKARVLGPAAAAAMAMRNMGMWLLYPPDVAGWEGGQAWISSATMLERIAWGERLFGQGKAMRAPLRYPAYALLSDAPEPAGVVRKLVSVFDAPLEPAREPILVDAAQKASGGALSPENANATAAAVTRLIFATPEFQFA